MLTRYEQFTFLIAGIHRHIQRIEREEMEKYGYKGSFAQYLAAMSRFPEGITSTRLCEICDKDKAAVSRAVTEMAGMGLVYRDGSADTNYRARLRLTPEGEQAARFVLDRASEAVSAGGKGLSEEERRIFYAALDLIVTNLEHFSIEEGSQS